MSARLKLIVAYDGASFAGWQSQANRNTIQDHLEKAFERDLPEDTARAWRRDEPTRECMRWRNART